jgi:hypothetical protein
MQLPSPVEEGEIESFQKLRVQSRLAFVSQSFFNYLSRKTQYVFRNALRIRHTPEQEEGIQS